MRVHYIQNDPIVPLGFIEEWINEKGHSLSCTHMYSNNQLPNIDDFDMLILLGGRMGTYDEKEFPWLVSEKTFIREAIERNKAVLGICLGAQMIADTLGSSVYPQEHKEIGWWPIELTKAGILSPFLKGIPARFSAFEYHGDTFELPKGSIHLASSKGCQNQAFLYKDRIIGLQFHPEFNEIVIETLKEMFNSQEGSGKFIQRPAYWINQTAFLDKTKAILFQILNFLEEAAVQLGVRTKAISFKNTRRLASL